jgi:hypothetical protein
MKTIAALGITLILAGCLGQAGAAVPATDPGCGPAVMPSFADDSFTPFTDRRTQNVAIPTLGESGEVLANIAAASSRVPFTVLRATVPTIQVGLVVYRPAEEQIATYLAGKAIAPTDPLDTFLSAGGLLIAQQPAAPGRDATTVLEAVGARGTTIAVGPYDAAVVHADPGLDGQRPYHVYWSDGTRFIFAIAADPLVAIDAARSMYCSERS